MTVKEMIKALRKLPPEAEVFFAEPYDQYNVFGGIHPHESTVESLMGGAENYDLEEFCEEYDLTATDEVVVLTP